MWPQQAFEPLRPHRPLDEQEFAAFRALYAVAILGLPEDLGD